MHDDPVGCPCCGGGFEGLFGALVERGPGGARDAGPGPISRRAFLQASVAATTLAATLPAGARAGEPVTTVWRGGTVLTVDRDFSEARAIAVRGDRILAVGSEADVRAAAGKDAVVVELDGRTVLPGFVDPHTHVVTGGALDGVAENVGVSRFSTTAQVLEHLASRVATTPPGEWILARNFDPALQEGPRALTFAELDAVSREVPVFVINASGHLAYANRKAFAVAGVGEEVVDPPGAKFVRDAAGKLTGTMQNNVAFLQVARAAPAMARLDPVRALVDLLAKWSRVGLTCVSELSLGALTQSPKDAEFVFAAARSGDLRARIRAFPFYTIGSEAWDRAGTKPGAGDALARIAGYKLVADGSNQGFTGLQREPYVGTQDRGSPYMTPEEMRRVAVDRARQGWPLALHANGDAGVDMVLDACQAVRDAGLDTSRLRPRIEHCSMLHDDQIARMKALGVSASFLIGHVHYWGVWMRDRVFGPERVRHLVRCRSVEAAGVGFSLHSDFPVTDPDPLHMVQMAVTRRTRQEPDFVLNPGERVSVEAAIRGVTSEAAWQLFSDHEIGSLEPGKLADLVVLERDPRKVDPETLGKIRVTETWMGGKRVF